MCERRWTFGDDPEGSTDYNYAHQGCNEGDYGPMALLALEASKWDGKGPACDGTMEPSSWTERRDNNRFDPFGMKGQEYPNGEPIMAIQSI